MGSNLNRARHELMHYHACVHCGSTFRRDEFNGTAIVTGIYPCPKCDLDGPLNIVIQDVEESTPGTDSASSESSAS